MADPSLLCRLKTPEEILSQERRKRVDAYVTASAAKKDAEQKINELKAYFFSQAQADLRDTKLKSVDYWGSSNSRVTVTNSETLKPVSITLLKRLLGDVTGDYVKEKVEHDLTAQAKRLFIPVFQGDYLEGSFGKLLEQATADKNQQAALRKKLKGNFQKDKDTFMTVAELSEEDAEYYAYLVPEILTWETLLHTLQAAGWSGTAQEAIDTIKSAVQVEEGVKLTLDTEEKI